MGAFEAAENILEKQARQKRKVDQACANLRNDSLWIEVDTGKEKLEELIQSAEQIDVKLYTEKAQKTSCRH